MLETFRGHKLCIFVSKNDRYEGIVLYELLLEIAFNSRLSGGTITIGDKGFFGDHNETRKLKVLRSAENLPVVLEFQGRTDRINRYIERIQPMVKEGLLTLTEVQITKFNSPEENAANFEEKNNEEQAKIFKETERVPSPPEPEPELADNSSAEPEQAGMSSDSSQPEESTAEPEVVEETEPQQNIPQFDDDLEQAYDELKMDQPDTPEGAAQTTGEPDIEEKSQNETETVEDEPIEEPEPQQNIPRFDDDLEQAYDELTMDQPETPEDAAQTATEPHIGEKPESETDAVEDQPEAPEFQTLDDDQIQQEPVADSPENESDPIDEADSDDDEEVMQLADFSETPAEEKAQDGFDKEIHDPETNDEDNPESEKPKTEEELDELFAESAKEFESSFDDMLNRAGKTSGGDEKPEAEDKKSMNTEPESSKADEADKDVNSETKADDKNHIEKDLKNYFSELFIK